MIQKISIPILIAFIFLAYFGTASAQNSVSSSGSTIFDNGGSISFTVGQIVCKTISDTNISISQGVQQTYEISITSIADEIKGKLISCTTFPNPTSDLLMLSIDNLDKIKTTVTLYNLSGSLLSVIPVESSLTTINMSNLKSDIYFLHIIGDGKELKIFKIIKK